MSMRTLRSSGGKGALDLPSKKPTKEKSQQAKCEEFDEILDVIGSQGKFQKFFLYAVLSPICALEPLLSLNLVFMLFEPDHWCFVPGRGNDTSIESWKNLTLPMEEGPDGQQRFSYCHMYDANRTIIECNSGWEYDTKDFSATLPSDFNWVCSKAHYATDAFTLAAVGNAFGTIVYGQLADKIGRKPIFFFCMFLNIFGRILSLYIPSNFIAFLVLQFIVGSGFPMMFIAPAMIAAEISDKDFRAWIYSVTWMIWVIGMAFLPFLAWLCRHWFLIGMLTSAPWVVVFIYYKWMPESPRWLVSVGKIKEAAVVIRQIAEGNGTSDKLSDTQLDSMLKQLVIKQDQDTDKKVGVWTLFTRFTLAKNTLLLTTAWVMNAVIYYAITLNVSNMSGSQFINFFILAIIELPSGYLGSVLVDKAGRRWIQVLFFFLCILSSVIAGITVSFPDLSILTIIAAVAAKFAITLTFLVVYLQGTEIFPTQLRSTGSGFACTVASTLGIFTPYIVFLAKYNLGAPWFVVAVMALTGMISSAFLPETLNQSLPETVDDASNFGKNNKFWSFRPPSPKVATEKVEKF